MYQDINNNEYSDVLMNQMPKGIFLTVKTNDEINTMVIGWGQMGFIWGKKVFIAYIRYSRHTFSLIERAKEFTISVPLSRDLRDELLFCGQNSGRNINKLKHCNLTPIMGRKINTPIIGECDLHYECKVIYQQTLEHALLEKDIKDKYYENNDYHVVYYGEIVDSYLYNK